MFGSHLSIAGGLTNALTTAESLGLGTVQVFTKNQKTWTAPPLADDAVAAWAAQRDRLGFSQTVSHASYLINPASPDDDLRRKSIDLLADEVRRCVALGIPYLVMHPGAHMEAGEEVGLKRVAEALDEVRGRTPEGAGVVTICLESTAGQGTSLGYKLEHLASVMEQTKEPDALGVCLDTAHLWAAGYDLRGRKWSAFRRLIATTFGVDRVKVWHLNDSKKELGSRVDRHEHIGKGEIGLTGFRGVVRDAAWREVPKILETPKGDDEATGRPWDAINLEVLKAMT